MLPLTGGGQSQEEPVTAVRRRSTGLRYPDEQPSVSVGAGEASGSSMSPARLDKSTVADATNDEQGRSAVLPSDAASRQVTHDAHSADRRRADADGRRRLG